MSQHYPQLSGAPTAAVDCGVSSTRSAVTWATRGLVRPTVKQVRTRMLKPAGTTNPFDWERALRSYGAPALKGRYESIPALAIVAAQWDEAQEHVAAGKMVLLAVDYGVLRKLAPRKVGSKTFSGYHAIPIKNLVDGSVTDLDPLLDGRYQGCPKGPVSMPIAKLRTAAEAVGRKEAGRASVWACLVERAVRVGSGVDVPEPDEPVTLSAILADLWEAHDAATGAVRKAIAGSIRDLESLVGPYRGPGGEAKTGVKP